MLKGPVLGPGGASEFVCSEGERTLSLGAAGGAHGDLWFLGGGPDEPIGLDPEDFEENSVPTDHPSSGEGDDAWILSNHSSQVSEGNRTTGTNGISTARIWT